MVSIVHIFCKCRTIFSNNQGKTKKTAQNMLSCVCIKKNNVYICTIFY